MVETVRDNSSWLEQLRCNSVVQQVALSDLRQLLLQGLSRAMSTKGYVDESFLEDAVQDSLLVILDKLDTFQGRSKFITWATSIAVHVSMSKLRKKEWKDVSLDQLISDNEISFDGNDYENSGPEFDSNRSIILNKMYSIIQNKLTSKQRFALLSELKEVPQDEIARHLGCSRNAVYKLTHDARKQLKRYLESVGYYADDIGAVFTA